ncbi:unnamed protein product [Prunus brigantina]
MLLIDDSTRMIWVYFLRNKSKAFNCFKKFKSMTELQSGYKAKCLRSDKGGEFLSSEFVQFCEDHGIQRQLTMAYTPQQNGVVERKNRIVVEMAKSMLHEKGIPYFLWVEVVHIAIYILNRCPTKALNNITPFKAYNKRKSGIAHLKIFGSLCYVHVPTKLRHKLEPKSVKGVFVGYATYEKGYRIFYPISKKLTLDKAENAAPTPHTQTQYERSPSSSQAPSQHISSDISSEERNTQAYDHSPLKWRRLDDVLAKCNLCIIKPKKYVEAAQDESWLKAMEDELQMIEKNGIWELVDKPTDKPVIGVKWVYKTKLNLDGSVQKNKARLVAKGYAQKPGHAL